MCDYCDCRLQPEIAALSAEHEELLSLAAELRRTAGAGPSVAPIRHRLAELLLPHAAREERGVFAFARRAGIDDRYLGAFEAEHADLHELLAGDDVAAFADALADHIFREETDLFPAAAQVLGPRDWDAIATGVAA